MKTNGEPSLHNETQEGIQKDDNSTSRLSLCAELDPGDTTEVVVSAPSDKRKTPPDGGAAWLVIFAGAISYILILSIGSLSSLYFSYMLQTFEQSATTTALVTGTHSGVKFMSSPLTGAVINKLGLRKASIIGSIVTATGFLVCAGPSLNYSLVGFGIITALGINLNTMATFALPGLYFSSKRGRATSMLLTPGYSASLIFPTLMLFLWNHYGYGGIMIVMGGILLNLAPLAGMYAPVETFHKKTRKTEGPYELVNQNETNPAPEDAAKEIREEKPQENSINTESKKTQGWFIRKFKSYIDVTLLKNSRFILFCLVFSCFSFSLAVGNTFVVEYGKEKGLTDVDVTYLMMVMGIASIISRFAAGFVFDIPIVKTYQHFIFAVNCFLTGFSALSMIWTSSVASYIVASAIYRCFISVTFTQHLVVLSNIVVTEKVVSAIALNRLFVGVMTVTGPVLSGKFRDDLGNYDLAFITAAGVSGVSSVIYFCVHFYFHKTEKDESKARETSENKV